MYDEEEPGTKVGCHRLLVRQAYLEQVCRCALDDGVDTLPQGLVSHPLTLIENVRQKALPAKSSGHIACLEGALVDLAHPGGDVGQPLPEPADDVRRLVLFDVQQLSYLHLCGTKQHREVEGLALVALVLCDFFRGDTKDGASCRCVDIPACGECLHPSWFLGEA